MTWSLHVLREAEAELDAALRWYEKVGPLRLGFLEAIDRGLEAIATAPHRYPRWMESEFRRLVVQGYPYLVVYRVGLTRIDIVAFAHTRRRPGYWQHR